jgi:PAS domain S-box-containing protein
MSSKRLAQSTVGLLVFGGFLALLGLLGRALDTPSLYRFARERPDMQPGTAVLLMTSALGVALALHARGSRLRRVSSCVLGLAISLFGLLYSLEYVLDVDFGVDWRWHDNDGAPHPGRPSPLTAAAFLAMGASLTLFDVKLGTRMAPREWSALAVIFVAFVSLVGHAFGAGALYEVSGTPVIGVALPTGLALLAIGAAAMLARPRDGLMRIVTSEGPGGVLLRRLRLTAVLAAPLLGALLLAVTEAVGLEDLHLLFALGNVAAVFLALLLLVATAVPMERSHARAEASRRKALDLLEQAPMGVFVADLSGRYTEVNTPGCEMLGVSREEILGKTIINLIPPEDVERLWQSRQLILQGLVHTGEWRLRRGDGTYLPVEVTTRVLSDGRWQAFVQDITERVELERKLVESRDHLEELLQQARLQAAVTANLAEGVVLIRASDAVIVYANPRFETMFGYGRGELVGRPVHQLNADGDIGPEERARRITTELERAGAWQGEVENVRKDGTRIWCQASASTFDHEEHGKVWVTVHSDITERKLLEERNIRALRDKELLLKEVHHRVKNNLQVISSLFSLQRERSQSVELKALLDESRLRVQSIALVHEYLYRSSSLAAIDLDEYLRGLVQAVRSSYAAESVTIEASAPDIVLEAEDAVPCALLVCELVSNSLKHGFVGVAGRVTVRARTDAGGRCTIEVADNGRGIPEDFDWTKSDSLGLRLVGALARQLRGEVVLDRTRGTRFTVTFMPHRAVHQQAAVSEARAS